MPGQPVVIPSSFGEAFSDSMQRAALQAMAQAHSARLKAQELDFEQTQRDRLNSITSLNYFIENSPAESWGELAVAVPGVNAHIERVFGEGMAEQLATQPIKARSLMDSLNAIGTSILESNPALAGQVGEAFLIRQAAGVEGGEAGLETSFDLSTLQRDAIAGDEGAARRLHNVIRTFRGEPNLTEVTLPGGQRIEGLEPGQAANAYLSGLNFQATLADLELRAGQINAADADRLLDAASGMVDDFHRATGITINPRTMLNLQAAATAPEIDPTTGRPTGRTQLDALYQNDPERYGAIYRYFTDQVADLTSHFLLPMYGTPEGQAMMGSLSAIKNMKDMGMTGDDLLPMVESFIDDYRKAFPDVPIGAVKSGVNSFLFFDSSPSFDFNNAMPQRPQRGGQFGAPAPQRNGASAPSQSQGPQPASAPWEQMQTIDKVRWIQQYIQAGASDELIREAFKRSGRELNARWLTRAHSDLRERGRTPTNEGRAGGTPEPFSVTTEDVEAAPIMGASNPRTLAQQLIESYGNAGFLGAHQAISASGQRSALGNTTVEPPQRIAGITIADPNLAWIIQKESSGNPRADNPESTAFGLGQLLIANRRAYGRRLDINPDTTNPAEQLRMMEAYIKDRYGSSDAARRHWEQKGWY